MGGGPVAEERIINQLASQLIQQLIRAEKLVDELGVAKARIAELEAGEKKKNR